MRPACPKKDGSPFSAQAGKKNIIFILLSSAFSERSKLLQLVRLGTNPMLSQPFVQFANWKHSWQISNIVPAQMADHVLWAMMCCEQFCSFVPIMKNFMPRYVWLNSGYIVREKNHAHSISQLICKVKPKGLLKKTRNRSARPCLSA